MALKIYKRINFKRIDIVIDYMVTLTSFTAKIFFWDNIINKDYQQNNMAFKIWDFFFIPKII